MIHLLDPVPFTIENESHMGLSEVQGMLSSDGRNLVIEFRLADTVIGMMKSAARTIRVPLGDVQSIRFVRKYLGFVSEIELRTRSIESLAALPDAKLGSIAMRVRRADRAAAEELCLALREAVVRERGARLQEGIEGLLE